MRIMKFGGTSVADEQAIRRVVSIVRGRLGCKPLVVVSAMSKVTRELLHLAKEAEAQHTDTVEAELGRIRDKHIEVARALLSGKILEENVSHIENLCDGLDVFVRGVCQIGELSSRSRARILSTGELLSSVIVGAAMNENGIKCHWTDARRLIVTDDNYLSARPDMEQTQANILRIVPEEFKGADIVITQGFIASAKNGSTSVLGFEGSDYSAALLGMALGAGKVEIWTDVDGIRTADPRVVSVTSRIPQISYEEAAEMAFLGARVLHPLTIDPARSRNIPIQVLNSMNPEGEGSAVVRGDMIEDGPKSIAFRTDIDFIEISAKGFIRLETLVSEVFAVLNRNRVEISLMSISESGLSLTMEAAQAGSEQAYRELAERMDTVLYRDKGQISVTGKNVVRFPGLLDKINSAVGKTDMVAVGSSRMSISFVTDRADIKEIVERLHNILFG